MPVLPFEQFRFCGPSYQTVSPVADAERAFNLYPETNPGSAKVPVTLVGTPGLELFTTLGGGPIRALAAGNGRLFTVSGTHFYEIDPSTGSTITDYGAMPGSTSGPCKIVFGLVSGGPQLLVLDSSTSKIYYPDIAGPSMVAVFDGYDLEYLDTYYFALNAAIQNGVNCSASGDGGTWPSLNAITRTTTVDQTNALCVVNSNLWIFGQKTITPFFNAGTSGFPLALIQNSTIQEGALSWPVISGPAAFHIIKANNAVYWIGADDRGFGGFWRSQGFDPIRISGPGVENIVKGYGDISEARGFAYDEDGHSFVVWNFPNANSGDGATMVYDITTKLFHERMYLDGSTQKRWRPDCFASVEFGTGAVNFVGDYEDGRIYKLSLSYTDDDGDPIQRIRTAPIISADNAWLSHAALQIDADIGTASLVLTMSNDGARSFLSNSYTVPKIGTSAGVGVNTYIQNQLGRSRQRVYRVTITDADNPIRLLGAYANANP